MKKITLCCGNPRGCCPEIYLDFDSVVIKDDDGNMATMTTKQFGVLKKKIIAGEFDIRC